MADEITITEGTIEMGTGVVDGVNAIDPNLVFDGTYFTHTPYANNGQITFLSGWHDPITWHNVIEHGTEFMQAAAWPFATFCCVALICYTAAKVTRVI